WRVAWLISSVTRARCSTGTLGRGTRTLSEAGNRCTRRAASRGLVVPAAAACEPAWCEPAWCEPAWCEPAWCEPAWCEPAPCGPPPFFRGGGGLADVARHRPPGGGGPPVRSARQAPFQPDERAASARHDRTRVMRVSTAHHTRLSRFSPLVASRLR